MSYLPRSLTYDDEQQRALAVVREAALVVEEAKVELDRVACEAWRLGVTLSDVGMAAGSEGQRTARTTWAMRARDRVLARERVRSALGVR